MLNFFLYLCIALFIVICGFLILVVLIQKGRGGGLASAFGGAGGNTAFGSKTGDVLTWVTSIVFGVFLVLAVSLNLLADAQNRSQFVAPQPTVPESAPQTPSPKSAEAPAPAVPSPAVPPASTQPTTLPSK